jgi:hypothetical protein
MGGNVKGTQASDQKAGEAEKPNANNPGNNTAGGQELVQIFKAIQAATEEAASELKALRAATEARAGELKALRAATEANGRELEAIRLLLAEGAAGQGASARPAAGYAQEDQGAGRDQKAQAGQGMSDRLTTEKMYPGALLFTTRRAPEHSDDAH